MKKWPLRVPAEIAPWPIPTSSVALVTSPELPCQAQGLWPGEEQSPFCAAGPQQAPHRHPSTLCSALWSCPGLTWAAARTFWYKLFP